MPVVDASVWVAALYNEDKFHREAQNIIDDLITSGDVISVPTLVFVEVAGVLKRLTQNVKTVEQAIVRMKKMELDVWELDSEEMEPKATDIAAHYGVRGADACYIAVARLTSSVLFTFDKKQKEAYEEVAKSF